MNNGCLHIHCTYLSNASSSSTPTTPTIYKWLGKLGAFLRTKTFLGAFLRVNSPATRANVLSFLTFNLYNSSYTPTTIRSAHVSVPVRGKRKGSKCFLMWGFGPPSYPLLGVAPTEVDRDWLRVNDNNFAAISSASQHPETFSCGLKRIFSS